MLVGIWTEFFAGFQETEPNQNVNNETEIVVSYVILTEDSRSRALALLVQLECIREFVKIDSRLQSRLDINYFHNCGILI